MATLAIKGHATRGSEVIGLLEMLGGKHSDNMHGYNDELYYYVATDGLIYGSSIEYEDFACKYLIFTLEKFLEKFPYKVGDKVMAWINGYCGNHVIQEMQWDGITNEIKYRINGYWYSTLNLQPYTEAKEESMEKTIKIDIPKGYEFAGIDDDNQQVVFEKIGCQYPKTYEECCDILRIPNDERYIDIDVPLSYNNLLNSFTQLLICRDAYWKIAGNWKPNYDDDEQDKWGILKLDSDGYQYGESTSFVFSTEEMRDAFFGNFKELIESCKELL